MSTSTAYGLDMKAVALSAAEAELWHAWQLAGEAVMARVVRDVADATGLSGPDFGVLSRLMDLGDGELRQHDLADSMRWDKSRLSHQLTRMESRRLLGRTPADGRGVIVAITRAGRRALALARPIHAASIRRNLLSKIGIRRRAVLAVVCKELAADRVSRARAMVATPRRVRSWRTTRSSAPR
jgi:DNA-binding MarR family transcriptional regulator